MDTILEIIKYLPKYLGKFLEAWVVWVWSPALEVVVLILATFVPGFSPSWWLHIMIAGVAFVIANVKLLLESEKRLGAYEYQAPEYELKVTGVDAGLCRPGCHIEISCDVSMRATTPWTGCLAKVTVPGANPVSGLGDWTVDQVASADGYRQIAHWPVKIPEPMFNLRIRIRCAIDEPLDPRATNEWGNVRFPLHFIFQYFTQPVGDVQKLMTLPVQADLSDQAPVVLEHQTRKAREAQ